MSKCLKNLALCGFNCLKLSSWSKVLETCNSLPKVSEIVLKKRPLVLKGKCLKTLSQYNLK